MKVLLILSLLLAGGYAGAVAPHITKAITEAHQKKLNQKQTKPKREVVLQTAKNPPPPAVNKTAPKPKPTLSSHRATPAKPAPLTPKAKEGFGVKINLTRNVRAAFKKLQQAEREYRRAIQRDGVYSPEELKTVLAKRKVFEKAQEKYKQANQILEAKKASSSAKSEAGAAGGANKCLHCNENEILQACKDGSTFATAGVAIASLPVNCDKLLPKKEFGTTHNLTAASRQALKELHEAQRDLESSINRNGVYSPKEVKTVLAKQKAVNEAREQYDKAYEELVSFKKKNP